MKKLLAIALALVFCLSLVACGGGDPDVVAKYVQDSQAQIKQAFGALEQQGMSLSLSADGTTVVMTCASAMLDNVPDDQADTVEESLSVMEDAFGTALKSLQSECSDVDALRIVYTDSTGREIADITID